jgi:hypothetical protein
LNEQLLKSDIESYLSDCAARKFNMIWLIPVERRARPVRSETSLADGIVNMAQNQLKIRRIAMIGQSEQGAGSGPGMWLGVLQAALTGTKN